GGPTRGGRRRGGAHHGGGAPGRGTRHNERDGGEPGAPCAEFAHLFLLVRPASSFSTLLRESRFRGTFGPRPLTASSPRKADGPTAARTARAGRGPSPAAARGRTAG